MASIRLPSLLQCAFLVVPALEILLLLFGPPLLPHNSNAGKKGGYELNITVMKKRTGQIETSLLIANTVPVTNVGPAVWADGKGFLVEGSPRHACSKLKPKPEPDSFAHLLVSHSERDAGWGCTLERKLRQADTARYSMVLIESEGRDKPLPKPDSRLFTLTNKKFHFVTHVALLSVEEAAVLRRYMYPDSVRFYLQGTRLTRMSPAAWTRWMGFWVFTKNGMPEALLQVYVPLLILIVALKWGTEFVLRVLPDPQARPQAQHPARHVSAPRQPSPRRRSPSPVRRQQRRRPAGPLRGILKNPNPLPPNGEADGEEPQQDIVIKGQAYRRHRLLGRGAFGSVWLVKVQSRAYALKEVSFTAPAPEGQAERDAEVLDERIALILAQRVIDQDPDAEADSTGALDGEEHDPYLRAQAVAERTRARVAAFVQNFRQARRNQRDQQQAERLRSSFLQEVHILGRLKRPSASRHVVQLVKWELFEAHADGGPCGRILMECGGEDIRSRILNNGGSLTNGQLVSMWTQMVQAVRCIHGHGIVHLDLKHTNFVWFGETLKLVDFGTAWTVEALEENALAEHPVGIGGTLVFMAPEVLLDRVDMAGPPADVWSLGCILYFMLCGKTPLQRVIEPEMVNDPEAKRQWLEGLTVADIGVANVVPTRVPNCYEYYDYEKTLNGCLQIDPAQRALPDTEVLEIRLVRLQRPQYPQYPTTALWRYGFPDNNYFT